MPNQKKLEQQLCCAKKYKNFHRIQGLEKALARVNQECAEYFKSLDKKRNSGVFSSFQCMGCTD